MLKLAPLILAIILTKSVSAAVLTDPETKLSVQLDPATGIYTVCAGVPGWNYQGALPAPCKDMSSHPGSDEIGSYQGLTFSWDETQSPMKGAMRLYEDTPLILFSYTSINPLPHPPAPFPDFTHVPAGLHIFSYKQAVFSPPDFKAADCSTPWLLFDDHDHAAIISPASHFMVASMAGDGQTRVASGLDPKLQNLPANFTQQTLMAFGPGINGSWDLWGSALNALRQAHRPGNEADRILKYLGYWTDNGATYYYNYDPDKGYAGTLKALADHYRAMNIPIGYLQLDSWWYHKTFTGPDGKMGKTKNPKLPPGEWNRYGGLLEYKADTAVFPEGLEKFQKQVNLPFVTHNRWVDPASPYHQAYKFSGVAGVDGRWWDEIAAYMKSCGIETYEQDWLDRIYRFSPEFSSTVDTGATFVHEMARACAARGITIQYCMPYPCYFLEGSQYKNLTSIRVSDDRFMRARWNDFLYTSRLARSLGIWPWTDVFMSSETDNFLLSVLSAGPVGIGDPIGKEDMANISRAVRADGVIIKPDVPCVPLDQCYLRDANKGPKPSDPLLAWTCTDHHPLRTAYLFCYSRNSAIPTSASFSPSELGFKGTVYIYEPATGSGARQDAASSFSIALQPNQSHFYVIAPVGSSGIAFLGDSAKFVGTGKQRVSEITDSPEGIATTLLMCESEDSLQLHGYAPSAPTVTVKGGKAGPVNFDAATGHYTVGIFSEPASGANQPGSVRAVEVNITAHSRESGQNNQLDAGEAGS